MKDDFPSKQVGRLTAGELLQDLVANATDRVDWQNAPWPGRGALTDRVDWQIAPWEPVAFWRHDDWESTAEEFEALAEYIRTARPHPSRNWSARYTKRASGAGWSYSESLHTKRAPKIATRGAEGRPPKAFLFRLAAFGAVWLTTKGIPDTQAKLERALNEECERRGWSYSESQVREMAAELLAERRAQLRASANGR